MKLSLISCRSPFLDDDRIYPPLGLLYLKAAVQREHPVAEVTVTDSYDLEDLCQFEDADVVGVSIMTPQRDEASQLARALRRRHPGMTLVAGGPHVRHYSHELAGEPWDYLVGGDGERVLPAILRQNTVQRLTFDQVPRAELAAMPRPDRLGETEFLRGYSYTLDGLDSTTMMLGRGCPMACKFCEDAKTLTRWTSLANAEAELDDIVILGYSGVYLFDDLFAINLGKCEPYLKLLKRSGLRFRCNVHARFMTEEFARALADAGCAEVAFGAESGSQQILDRIDKKTTAQQNYDCVAHCKAAGITVKAFLMIGLPGETRATIAETRRFIEETDIDDAQIAIFYPYKGTMLRRELDEGLASDLSFAGEGLGAYGQKNLGTDSVVRTPELSQDDLVAIREELIRTYKFRSHSGRQDRFFDAHLARQGL
jgi:anaerobic magnesium-protoporphyrin IX monomethyl ester cyclase